MADSVNSGETDTENSHHNVPQRQPSKLNVLLSKNRSQQAQNKRPLPRRQSSYRPKLISLGPSESQLSAPYIEEVQPERPQYVRNPTADQTLDASDTALLNPPQVPEAQSNRSTSLRDYFRKVRLLNTINRILTHNEGEHLKDTENFETVVFSSPFDVPYLWAKTDYKGRKAPPVLFSALKLAVTDSYHDEKNYNLQNVFRIELEYGDVKWVINRSGFDFASLYVSLKKEINLPHIPRLPTGLANWFKSLIRKTQLDNQARNQTTVLQRRKDLENYLIQLLRALKFSVAYELYEFLELSAVSITSDMGWKGKECHLNNKVERFKTPICSFRNSNEKWVKEWVIVRDSYIAFCSDISSTIPTDVFLMDKFFKCDKMDFQGLDRMLKIHDHVDIENSSRRIEMKGDNRTLSEFLESIEKVKRSSPWVRQHRFDSYAPIRENAKVKWYVDGKNYFFAVSQAIMAAKLEIYIEDWWLSPELYLRRPPSKNEKYRLDNLLKKKAEEGVMIYIIVYKEVKLALTLDSWHTKTCLQHLHPNIRVQRHPDHGPDGTVFWAHHEKMLIIDCKIAFIGGLDLCFGRYDTHQHELVDFDPHSDNPSIWPGQDYSNPRVKDFNNVSDYNAEIVDKSRVPRMPWHDVSIGVVGHPARDIARHFIQRWNFIKEEKAFERESIPFLMPKGEYVSTRDESKFFGTCNIQLLRSSASWSSGIELENSIYNAYCHLIRSSEHFIYIENQFFITASEKDPDHEIKNRIGEFIVERIKKAHKNNEKFRIIVVMPLLPAFEADLHSKDAGTIRMIMHWQYLSISRGGKSILEKISEAGINPENYISFFALRGHGKIRHSENRDKKTSNSTDGNDGSQNVNNVINGSKDSINNSGKTSSIENNKSQEVRQSHPSETTVDSFSDERPQYISNVNERIGGEPVLPDSIKQMDPKHIFVTEEIYIHSKLMIVDDRFVICGSANLNDRSQLGNRDSEIAIIVEDKETIDTFMNGKKYKASKFAYTLRSNLFKEHLGLLETQDHSTMTESCLPPLNPEALFELLYEKDETATSLLDAQTNEIKKCSTEELVFMDPLSDEFYNYWSQIAQNNTETYRSLFRCVPDDNVADWEQYKEFVPDPTKMFIGHVANPNASVEEIKRKLSNIRGHLVQFPTQFLKNEHLMGGMISNAVEIFT
ncbi:unnamed protein product [Rhizophagus irregularis]|uniref:Phospholipase n=1 Tax=Rhizophagus irregularis TaxID=588596 RepID=A0A2N1NM33_9GLOM|nr:phospholipase D/nuclease [Rhizophagus irregularis]CAB4387759.1 unnamed protein product [Rhizophagus irregularis]CAB5390423.1 unnamed protein product [Rhizophagus irregularis]